MFRCVICELIKSKISNEKFVSVQYDGDEIIFSKDHENINLSVCFDELCAFVNFEMSEGIMIPYEYPEHSGVILKRNVRKQGRVIEE